MGEAYGSPGSTLRLYLQAVFKAAQILLRAMASPAHPTWKNGPNSPY